MATQENEPAMEYRTVIRFTERPGIRRLLESDFLSVGVRHKTVEWGPANNWTVPREDLGLTDDEYARIILPDRNLREEREEIGPEA